MRVLGLDVGDKRTGVAISDSLGILAIPLTVIADKVEDATIDDIINLAGQYEVKRVVVGIPYSLNGTLGQQATKVKSFIDKLAKLTNLDIQLWDERLSTKAAERLIMEAGGKGDMLRSRKRKGTKGSRSAAKVSVDAMAAAYILQGFLDSLGE